MRDMHIRVAGFAGVAASVAGLCWVFINGALNGFWTETTAAWIQAVGVLVALFIAVWLPIEQHRRNVAHHREAALSLALQAHAEIAAAWLAADDHPGVRTKWTGGGLAEVSDLLQGFPNLQLDSVPALLTMREVRMSVEGARDAWSSATAEHFPPQRAVQIYNIARSVQGLLQRLIIELGLPRERLPPEVWQSMTAEQVKAMSGPAVA